MSRLSRRGVLDANTAFTPASLAGLAAWYDASDAASITSSAGAVSQWNDKSGNARHLVQATGTKQPTTGTRTQNGLNALDFSSNQHNLRVTFTAISQPLTLFGCVLADTMPGNVNRWYDSGSGVSPRELLYGGGSALRAWTVAAGGTDAVTAHNPVTGTAVVQSVVFNGASTAFYENGTQYGGTLSPGTAGTAGICVSGDGSGFDTNGMWDGLVCEICLYSSALSSTDRGTVETYLRSKWGV